MRGLLVKTLVFLTTLIDASAQYDARNSTEGSSRQQRRQLSSAHTSLSGWISAAALAGGSAAAEHSALTSKAVPRRTAHVDGEGATLLYKPGALERGDFHLDTTMSCLGWREAVGCDPHGPLASLLPTSCEADVGPQSSGYCECQVSGTNGPKVHVNHVPCGHAPFRCKDVCRQPPRRQCRGFVLMDRCVPLPPGHNVGGGSGRDGGGGGGSGWHFLTSRGTVCDVTQKTAPLGSVPACWRWRPSGGQSCGEVVDSTSAGYCECGGGLLRPEAIKTHVSHLHGTTGGTRGGGGSSSSSSSSSFSEGGGGGGLNRVRLECGHPEVSCQYVCASEAEPLPPALAHPSPHRLKLHDAGLLTHGHLQGGGSKAAIAASPPPLPPPLPVALSWAWHTKAGVWHSAGSDRSVAPLAAATATSKALLLAAATTTSEAADQRGGARDALLGLSPQAVQKLGRLPLVQKSPSCREPATPGLLGGSSSSSPSLGCIGKRSKWSLAPPLSYELRKAQKTAHQQVLAGPPWLVGYGVTSQHALTQLAPKQAAALTHYTVAAAASASKGSGAQPLSDQGLIEHHHRLGLLFEYLPSCAKFAAVGDCSKVHQFCPVSCGTLLLHLQPSPELCAPRALAWALHRTQPTSDAVLRHTAASAASASASAFRPSSLLDANGTRSAAASTSSRREMVEEDGEDPVQDYLRGVLRAATMRVVVLAFVRAPTSTAAANGGSSGGESKRSGPGAGSSFDSLKGFGGGVGAKGGGADEKGGGEVSGGWRHRLALLRGAVGRFKDYRVLVQAHDVPDQDAMKAACSEHRRVHCQSLTFNRDRGAQQQFGHGGAGGVRSGGGGGKGGSSSSPSLGAAAAAARRAEEDALGTWGDGEGANKNEDDEERRERVKTAKKVEQKAAKVGKRRAKNEARLAEVTSIARRQQQQQQQQRRRQRRRRRLLVTGGAGLFEEEEEEGGGGGGGGGGRHGDPLQASSPSPSTEGGEGEDDSAEDAYAKASLLEMLRHVENGALRSWELVVLVDLSLGVGIAASTASADAAAASRRSTSSQHNAAASNYHPVDVLGWDPEHVYRSLGRASPLGGFDVLCASPLPPPPPLTSAHAQASSSSLAPLSYFDFTANGAVDGSGGGVHRFGDGERCAREPDSTSQPQAGGGGNSAAAAAAAAAAFRRFGSTTHSKSPPSRLLPVDSCFGGLALYNPKALEHCDYPNPSSSSGQQPHAKQHAKQQCDHDGFHECLRGSGFGRIFVDPLLTTYRQPSKRKRANTRGGGGGVSSGTRLFTAPLPFERACVQLDDPAGLLVPPSF